METGGASRPLHILLSGPPGIGKTTICKKIASMLSGKRTKFDGFYTEEVRNGNGTRIGFDIVKVTNPEERSSLARLKSSTETQRTSKYQVGNYQVFLDNFEALALPILNSDTDVLLIDEIGKMELFSADFKKKVMDIFFGPCKKALVIGTIPQIHKVPQRHTALFDKLRANKGIKILNVSRENRDNLPDKIISHLS